MTIRRTVKKIFGLFFLYCCIILGIFALQFRNELLYTKNFGQLKVTLRKTKTGEQNPILKNNFRIVYKGLLVFADGTHPLVLLHTNGSHQNVTLLDYKEDTGGNGFTLFFDSEVSLNFSTSGSDSSPGISIQADLPPMTTSLQVPYKTAGGFVITEEKPESMLFVSKNGDFLLAGTAVSHSEIIFTPQELISQYSAYLPSVRFQYASVTEKPKAQAAAYAESIKQFRSAFLAEITPAISSSIIERDVVAYVSEMLLLDNYQQALGAVSPAFQNNSRRSFLSVPFFGNTVALSSSLAMYFTNQMNKLQQAQTSRRLDIFETPQLFRLLLLRNNAQVVKSILSIPAEQNLFQPTPLQAAGILEVYADLRRLGQVEVVLLEPILAACLDRLADSLKPEGDLLVLQGEEESDMQTVRVSSALVLYGNTVNRTDVAAAGYLLFNSLMASGKIRGAQAYADLYPFAAANEYYPHIALLSQQGSASIWAWTASPAVSYTVDAAKTVTISIQFHIGDAHYMIINDVEPFEAIEMYGLRYRSDRQFESYNSSGYVYLPESKTLLLKIRNREEKEIVRLFYTASEIAEN